MLSKFLFSRWFYVLFGVFFVAALAWNLNFSMSCWRAGGQPVFLKGSWPLCVKSSLLVNPLSSQ